MWLHQHVKNYLSLVEDKRLQRNLPQVNEFSKTMFRRINCYRLQAIHPNLEILDMRILCFVLSEVHNSPPLNWVKICLLFKFPKRSRLKVLSWVNMTSRDTYLTSRNKVLNTM